MVEKKFINGLTGKVDENTKVVYLDKAFGYDYYDTIRYALSILKDNSEYNAISVQTNASWVIDREYYITQGMTFDDVKEKYLIPENDAYKKLVEECAVASENAPENAEINKLKSEEAELERQIKELMEKKKALSSKRSGLVDQINKREREHISKGMHEYYDKQAESNKELVNELVNLASESQAEPNA